MSELEPLPSGKQLSRILCRYLIDHSSRRLNFLYWNMIDAKDASLCFVNINGKELNRINNPDLAFRIVKIRKSDEWNIVRRFFDEYLIDETDRKAVYVVRIDYLLRYLKSINFDLSRFELTRNAFGTAFGKAETDKVVADTGQKAAEPLPLATVDNDIQSLYLVDRLYLKYKRVIRVNESSKSEIANLNVEDITQVYLEQPEFSYVIPELNVVVPLLDSIDAISRKFAIDELKNDPTSKIEQIYMNDGVTSMVNRFMNTSIVVVSTRVYLQYFLSMKTKKRK